MANVPPATTGTTAGTIRLCSTFSTADPLLVEDGSVNNPRSASQPCGNNRYFVNQIRAMVAAVNALNHGRGFEVAAGRPQAPLYYKFSYTYQTYTFGSWEAVNATSGESMSMSQFSGCDLIVGQPNGCPDPEIIAQAKVANNTGKIYITGRGPRAVLTAGGSPYMFSSHIRSDTYANNLLQTMRFKGAATLSIIHEDYGNSFYLGIAQEARRHALSQGFTVSTTAISRPPSGSSTRVARAHSTRASIWRCCSKRSRAASRLRPPRPLLLEHKVKLLYPFLHISIHKDSLALAAHRAAAARRCRGTQTSAPAAWRASSSSSVVASSSTSPAASASSPNQTCPRVRRVYIV